MTRFAREYRRIARRLSQVELMEQRLDAELDSRALVEHGQRRFLDFYGDEGLHTGLSRYGLFDALRRRGYDDFEIETHADDERHTLLLFASSSDGAGRVRLVDLVVRRDCMVPDDLPGLDEPAGPFEVLTIDWLGLRDPTARFTDDRPRLPGQDAPGLGVGERVVEVLYRAVERLHLDALVTVAAYFHNAILYLRELPYFDPAFDGQTRSLAALLMDEHGLSLAQASWAIEWDLVCREDGSPFPWRGQLQLWPKHEALASFLHSAHYRRAAEAARRRLRFRLDRAAFDERWARERDALTGRAQSSEG